MRKIIIPNALVMPLAMALIMAALAAMAGGCSPGGSTPDSQEPAEAAVAAAPDESCAEGTPENSESEASDLDQSVEALFEASCEHDLKTFACEECRYEVGVARAPANLFEGGLLHVAQPAREPVRVPLALTGEVRFDERRVAHLSSPAAGIVRRVPVTIGDYVRRGDTLVEIESGEAGAAAAELREAQSLLTLAEERHERTRQLREQGIAPEKELRQAAQETESARIRLEAAQSQMARLGASIDAGGGLLRLRAPANGTVLTLHAVGGEAARPDELMATIGDVATVWVWADLYERDLSRLATGPQPAEVSVRAWPGQTFAGTVDFVSPSIDETSRTVKLRVTVPNPDGRLLAGMFASVEVFLPGDQEALALPGLAVLEDEGRRFVFVHHHDDFYVRRPVTVGRSWGDRLEITGGLRGDETVVSGGAFLLKSDVLRSKMGAGCAD
jgi:cobalt-zinc-cadmium efflux system membrane fusion protein